MRFAVAAVLFATAAATVTAAGPAAADDTVPVCQTVIVDGTITGTRTIGPACVPAAREHCEVVDSGLSPEATVFAEICVPIP